MTRIIFVLLTLFSITACKKAEPISSDETSPSGIKFSLMQMADEENVVVQVAWPTDWAFRSDTNADASYIGTDLILAGGAEGYAAGQVGEKFADLKAEGSLRAGADFVFGFLKFKKSDEKEVVKIANAHLVSPTLDQAWLDRVRDGISSNMAANVVKPESQLYDTVRWAILGTHPLRKFYASSSGADINLVTRENVKQWVAETLTRKPKALVVAGALTAQEAGAMVDELLAKLPEPTRATNTTITANFAPRRILLHAPQITTSQLFFAAPVPPTRDGNDVEDLLLIDALGGGDASALFQAVRTELRASYGFSAGIDVYAQTLRILFMNGEIETSKMAQAEKTVRQAYHAFHQSGVKTDISFLKAPYLEAFESLKVNPVVLSNTALQAKLDDQPAFRALGLRRELDAITADGVNARLAKSFPKVDDFLVVAISPDANALPGACVITKPEEAVNCP